MDPTPLMADGERLMAMDPNRSEAKQLFWDYACNHYFMALDGTITRYRNLGATSSDEAQWRAEYVACWTRRLAVDDLEPLNRLRNAHATEAVPDIMKVAEKGDAYAKLQYANALWELAAGSALSGPPPFQVQAQARSRALWKELAAGTGNLTPEHEELIRPNMEHLGAATPADYVKILAQQQLDWNGID